MDDEDEDDDGDGCGGGGERDGVGGSYGVSVPADPISVGLGGVPLTTTFCSFSSSPLPFVLPGFFSSWTFLPMMPRYQNMRLEIKTCSNRGRRALASLM